MSGSRHAVVLSGGGANGAFEVGVIKALFDGQSPVSMRTPLDADVFTGTSVGSFNAAFMVSQPDEAIAATVEELEHLWLTRVAENPARCGNGVFRFRGDLLDFFNSDCLATHPLKPVERLFGDSRVLVRDGLHRAVHFLRDGGRLGKRTLDLFDLSAFVSIEPLLKLVEDTISLDGLSRTHRDLRIAATNFGTGELKVFEQGDLSGAIGLRPILASVAIPGFFPPVEIAGETYVDGGLVMNTPLLPALRAGADVIHLIYLDPDVKDIPLEHLRNTYDTMDRMMTIQFAIKVNEDVETVQWINRGLEVVEQASRSRKIPGALTNDDLRRFFQTAGQIARSLRGGVPYRKVTIHRYHPRDDLGGPLGLLNFDKDRIAALINRGYEEATHHDCVKSECVVPT